MLICLCGHFDTSHGTAGYCFAGACPCERFREHVQASNAARKAAEDEISRDTTGYEDTKGESA